MDLQQIIGLTAGALTTISFIPQVIRTAKSRSSRDLSLLMVILFLSGIVLWLCYGIMAHVWPIILTNAATLVLALILLFFMLRNRK
jgi:MtN3 and saliva related transmembrane protein